MIVIVLQYFFYFVVVLSSCTSVYYSLKARREQETQKRGLISAKMNISLGIMLVSISCLVMFFKGSSVRILIGAIFLVIGLFNAFAGIRNYSFYQMNGRN